MDFFLKKVEIRTQAVVEGFKVDFFLKKMILAVELLFDVIKCYFWLVIENINFAFS